MTEKKIQDEERPDGQAAGKEPYEAPKVESVQLTPEAAEALT